MHAKHAVVNAPGRAVRAAVKGWAQRAETVQTAVARMGAVAAAGGGQQQGCKQGGHISERQRWRLVGGEVQEE